MVGTSPKDLVAVEQSFYNGEKSVRWVSKSDYERAAVGRWRSQDYWQHRVNLYKEDGTYSHVAHTDTLKFENGTYFIGDYTSGRKPYGEIKK